MLGRAIFRDIIDPNSAVIRQQLIAKIQPHLDPPGSLLVYTANPGHPFAFIMSQDAPLLEDLLRTLDSKVGYLMVTSPGGDPNAAEKMLIMCRERFDLTPESESSLMLDWAIRKGALYGQEVLHAGTDYQQAPRG